MQLLNCNHRLIDDPDYQDISIQLVDFRNQHHFHTMLSRTQFIIGSKIEQKESEPSRMSISDVKTRPPKNARATQDSCVPGHHYHHGSPDMFS